MIIYNLENYDKSKNDNVTCVIGDFDGVHLGHKFLIENCKKIANIENQKLIIITFYKNTKAIIKEIDNNMIINNEDKNLILKNLGVDGVIYIDFNEIKNYCHNHFVNEILINKIGCNNICVGHDFRFGKNKSGGINDLKNNNINVHVIEKIKYNNDIEFSSSAARFMIENGCVDKVCDILGYEFSICGVVVEGNKIGRTIGFPTANVEFENYVYPKFGVYAVEFETDGVKYFGAANFGIKPTIGAKKPALEIHIINFNQNIYNKKVRVTFKKMIRDEKKFANIDDLKIQIKNDVGAVNEYFTK